MHHCLNIFQKCFHFLLFYSCSGEDEPAGEWLKNTMYQVNRQIFSDIQCAVLVNRHGLFALPYSCRCPGTGEGVSCSWWIYWEDIKLQREREREKSTGEQREWRDNTLFINPSLIKHFQCLFNFNITLSMNQPNFCSLVLWCKLKMVTCLRYFCITSFICKWARVLSVHFVFFMHIHMCK